MSLVGFKAQNHPQQQASDEVDDRAVTMADFDQFHSRFRFTIDAAAAPHNARLPRFWTRTDDALSQPWAGERVWCNPPYSNIRPWVEKASHEWILTRNYGSPKGSGPELIVMLLPNNRCEQRWWQDLIEPRLRGNAPLFHVEFLSGRMRFERPNAVIGPKGDRPPFGCLLLVWGSDS